MQDMPETPDERLKRRRVRRWKRRARVIGPFLGVPLLLLTLFLSVDLIEYQPQPDPDRLADRPIRMAKAATSKPIWPNQISSSEFDAAVPDTPDDVKQAKEGAEDPDVMLPLPAVPAPETPPLR